MPCGVVCTVYCFYYVSYGGSVSLKHPASSRVLCVYQSYCLLDQWIRVSSKQQQGAQSVSKLLCSLYQTSVQVYHLSSRVRGVYRSYCVSDQNPPPPQCQPAPVLAHTQGGRDVRWKAGEIFWRKKTIKWVKCNFESDNASIEVGNMCHRELWKVIALPWGTKVSWSEWTYNDGQLEVGVSGEIVEMAKWRCIRELSCLKER